MKKTEVFDFTRFQEEIFPQWAARFKAGRGIGEYSFRKGGPTTCYGTTDILISKCIMGDLQLSEKEKDSWAESIHALQNPRTGWYRRKYTITHYREHTAAYATAALKLIDRGYRIDPAEMLKIAMKCREVPMYTQRDFLQQIAGMYNILKNGDFKLMKQSPEVPLDESLALHMMNSNLPTFRYIEKVREERLRKEMEAETVQTGKYDDVPF